MLAREAFFQRVKPAQTQSLAVLVVDEYLATRSLPRCNRQCQTYRCKRGRCRLCLQLLADRYGLGEQLGEVCDELARRRGEVMDAVGGGNR